MQSNGGTDNGAGWPKPPRAGTSHGHECHTFASGCHSQGLPQSRNRSVGVLLVLLPLVLARGIAFRFRGVTFVRALAMASHQAMQLSSGAAALSSTAGTAFSSAPGSAASPASFQAGLGVQFLPASTISLQRNTRTSSCSSRSQAGFCGLRLQPRNARRIGGARIARAEAGAEPICSNSLSTSTTSVRGGTGASKRFENGGENAVVGGGLSSPFGAAYRRSFQLGGGNGVEKVRTRAGVRCRAAASSSSASSSRPASQPRFIQHKQEAFWFYRFLSIVYDHVINPGHWTEDMREDALEPADLNDKDLVVVDVGGGTGFATLGIVKTVDAKNVTILDQSPHQLAKAKEKAPLKDCTILEGDAEDLPFDTDYADRYVSAGSIEYWPDPQRGIKEAYRVLKKGGKACLIGPVHPTFWLSRFFADVWMLFPTEDEYIDWFTKAGFTAVQIKRIGPKWYRGVRRHGLIMGCSVTGVKAEAGDSPLQLGPKAEDSSAPFNPVTFAYRFIVGTIAALYYVLIPIYMWLKDLVVPKGQPI